MVRTDFKSLKQWLGTALSAMVLAASFMSAGGTAFAAERTIIESLDAEVDRKVGRVSGSKTLPKAYDYSVRRELLPPLDQTGGVQGGPGWEVVVTAQDIKTGSLASPTGSGSSTILIIIFSIVAVTSLVLIGRQLVPHVATALEETRLLRFVPQIDLTQLTKRLSGLVSTPLGARNKKERQTDAPDEQIQAAAADLAKRLQEIEHVVAQLKDGSPLRDVLNQELRLIHYRISAANDAAQAGHDTPERSAVRYRGLVRELERVRRFADGAAASVIDPHDQLALPSTPNEAYAMLGVNQDAPIAAVKKLVDALRVTWHPDHARNESDRLLREERIKQINSAWDLINPNARRAEASGERAWT